jgi:hypothetical protein
VLVKQQPLILNRSRKRAPRLHLSDHVVADVVRCSCARVACSESRSS